MGLRTIAAGVVCKGTYRLLRLLGRGATALPGKLALKVDPEYLRHLSAGVKTVVLTGTNGKTTSTHIVAQALENAGLSAFYNRSGSNLIQGITTEFSVNCSITGKPRHRYAVIECDEGALRRVCAALDPDVVLVTNVFRDQLDRYGEVMHTRENILAGLRNAPHAQVLLNADCSITASLAADIPNPVSYYGVDCEIYPKRVPDLSDATHCIRCGTAYAYEYRTYAHLGGFTCPSCGYARPRPGVAVEQILGRSSNSCELQVRVGEERAAVHADVPADYDIYNCVAAIAALTAFGLPAQDAYAAVGHFRHGFGRGEVFNMDGCSVRLMLMKNPAGCNQIINLLLNEPDQDMGLCCILSDAECDGTDVSWIYDAAWEELCATKHAALCGGARAEDMALRLKYAGLPAEGIRIVKDYDQLIDELGTLGHAVTVVANYSSMLEFHSRLASRLGLAGFWEG